MDHFQVFFGFVTILLLFFFFFSFFFFKFYFIFKFYIIVLVLPNIKMNPPQVYMCWFFGCKACGIQPASPALEGKVLTTGSAGTSL